MLHIARQNCLYEVEVELVIYERVRRARVDGFFSKTVLYPSHTRARRGYTDTTGTGTEVLGHTGRRVGNGTGRRVKRYNGLLNSYNDL
jgi:hypothetical protein